MTTRLASDLTRGPIRYGSILGSSSTSLVPDLDNGGGRGQEHAQRVHTGEDSKFCKGPGDEAQRFAALFQGMAAVTASSRAPLGLRHPSPGRLPPSVATDFGLGDGTLGRNSSQDMHRQATPD